MQLKLIALAGKGTSLHRYAPERPRPFRHPILPVL